MEENEEELIKTFKKLEKKLRSEIKKMPSTIQDSNDTKVLKQRIKSYIEQLNEIKLILDDYERVAEQIEKLASKKNGEHISKTVVDFRAGETVEILELNKNLEEAENAKKKEEDAETSRDEQIIVNGKVVGVKKKKSNKSVREM